MGDVNTHPVPPPPGGMMADSRCLETTATIRQTLNDAFPD